MVSLDKNWLTEGAIDFEYKKYLFLAYLQDTAARFDEKKLYPRLTELVEHFKSLRDLKEQKVVIARDFPKEISRLDLENFRVEYKSLFQDDELIKEVDAIIEFALPQIENNLTIGKELYEEVEDKLSVFPVGIVPLRTDEGYFFLSDFLKKLVSVYYYQISIFENIQERFRGINTSFLFDYNISVTDSYERVKYKLIEQRRHLPNPATYAIEFKQSFPLPETMLPVAKRSLIRYISA
jgi:hypothetical protein